MTALKITALSTALCGVASFMMFSGATCGNAPISIAGNDGEIFGHVVGDAEGGQRAAGHQQLLADLDDLDQLGRVAVEIDHVAGFLGGLGAGVHGHADVGLGQRRGVVGAVAGHGDQVARGLLLLEQGQLVFGRGLGEEIIHARFLGDGGGGQRVVAGDHDRLDAHRAEALEPIGQARS